MSSNELTPLCVDLDGTLIKTDTLHELVFRAVKNKWWMLFYIPFLIFKGKVHLKRTLNEKADIEASLLPFNEAFLAWLIKEKQLGRKLYLVTGAYQETAETIAEHYDLFDEVIGSKENTNLTGDDKAKLLVERFGEHSFDYAGNAEIDKKVWRHSDKNILVRKRLG